MSARVAVVVFPGTNSEDETLRALTAVGLDAEIVHWSRGAAGLRPFDAYVLPGGFSYEDRVRAGAVAAHDEAMDAVIEAAQRGKFVLGICNGAQTLLEAAFAPNASGKFQSQHVYVRLNVAPGRLPMLASLSAGCVIPAWASHGEGRLAATEDELDRLQHDGHIAFVYCDANGADVPAPNGSARGAAALTNSAGNVLAIMPHPERSERAIYAPSGGILFFGAFAAALAGTLAT